MKEDKNDEKSTKKRAVVLIVLVAVICIALIVGAILMIAGKPAKKNVVPVPTIDPATETQIETKEEETAVETKPYTGGGGVELTPEQQADLERYLEEMENTGN